MFAIGIAYHKQFLPDIELSSNFRFSDQMPSVYLIVPQQRLSGLLVTEQHWVLLS